jgi:hypothetical protein
VAFIHLFGSGQSGHVCFHLCVVDSVIEEVALLNWTTLEQPLETDPSNLLESANFISVDFQNRMSAFERDVIQ